MTRDPARIDPILARLRGAWIKRPDLRLGQLLAGSLAIDGAEDRFNRMFQAECDEFGAANAPIAWPPVDRPAPTATAAHGTVGGLLATAPVGSIVEFWHGATANQITTRVGGIDDRVWLWRYRNPNGEWSPWDYEPPSPDDLSQPGEIVPADPNQRGPLPKGDITKKCTCGHRATVGDRCMACASREAE